MNSSAIEVMAKPQGRIQRIIIDTLGKQTPLSTSDLAAIAYGRDGEFENHGIIRAIKALTKRGFTFTRVRKGLVNRSGYVYMWTLT